VLDGMSYWTLKGIREADAPFTVAVADSAPFSTIPMGTLTITQQ